MPDQTFISDTCPISNGFGDSPAVFAVRISPEFARELIDLMALTKKMSLEYRDAPRAVCGVYFIEYIPAAGNQGIWCASTPVQNQAWDEIKDDRFDGVFVDEQPEHFGLDEDELNDDERYDSYSIRVWEDGVYFNACYRDSGNGFESRCLDKEALEAFAAPSARAEREEAIARLAALCDEKMDDDSALDELVSNIASHDATDINNSGFEGQVRFIVEALGATSTEIRIKEILGFLA